MLVIFLLFQIIAGISPVHSGAPWTHNEPIDIYESTSLSSHSIVAGTGSNYPSGASLQVFDIRSKVLQSHISVPDPTGATSEKVFAYISTSPTGISVLSAQIYGTNKNLWSFSVPGNTVQPEKGTLRFSKDGSKIFLSVNSEQTNGAIVWWFDGTPQGNGKPLGQFNGPAKAYIRDLVVSSNGTIASMVLSSTVVVLDTRTKRTYQHQFDASDAILCMDGDAKYIGYGFTTTWLLGWTGSSYQLLTTYNVPGTPEVAFSCAIGGKNGQYNWAIGYSDYSYNQNKVAKFSINATKVPTVPDWIWTGPTSPGGNQDGLFKAAATADGTFFAFAGWGNSQATSPQVVVFSAASMNPVLTYITPGSMFDVDIIKPNPTQVFVSAAGKHVHANVMGDGGDLFLFDLHIK